MRFLGNASLYGYAGGDRVKSFASLTCAAVSDGLNSDNYERARTDPAARKYSRDRRSIGVTYVWRHGVRAEQQGRFGTAVAWRTALLPATLGAGVFYAAAAASVGLLYGGLMMEEIRSRHIRSQDGVREDMICRRLRAIRYELRYFASAQGQESLITGETKRREMSSSCAIAREAASEIENSQQLSARLQRSPEIARSIRRLRGAAAKLESMLG